MPVDEDFFRNEMKRRTDICRDNDVFSASSEFKIFGAEFLATFLYVFAILYIKNSGAKLRKLN